MDRPFIGTGIKFCFLDIESDSLAPPQAIFTMVPASASDDEMDAVPSPITAFDAYQAHLQKSLITTTKYAHALPAKDDISFQRTLDRNFAQGLDECSVRVLRLLNNLISLAKGVDDLGEKRTEKGNSLPSTIPNSMHAVQSNVKSSVWKNASNSYKSKETPLSPSQPSLRKF